jgi:hypothetical protein
VSLCVTGVGLFVATSQDLRHWIKHGPAFARTRYVRRPTKSGAILTALKDGRLVAARHGGKYWMYWGEGLIYAATSDDLIAWSPVEADTSPDGYLTWDPGALSPTSQWRVDRVPGTMGPRALCGPRRRRFDSRLTEPGPPALLTDAGIVLIYNGANHPGGGDPATPALAYQPGRLLFDAFDPTAVVARALEPFLRIDPAAAGSPVGRGTYQWDGASGVWYWIDPQNDLLFVGMIQRVPREGMPRPQDLTQSMIADALLA